MPLASKYGFREAWLEDPLIKDWIAPVMGDDTKAACTLCDDEFPARLIDIASHAKSTGHRANKRRAMIEKAAKEQDVGLSKISLASDSISDSPLDGGIPDNPHQKTGISMKRKRGRPTKVEAAMFAALKEDNDIDGDDHIYQEAWARESQFKGWLGGVKGDPQSARCRVCCKTLIAHHNSLIRHAKTWKHLRNLAADLGTSNQMVIAGCTVKVLNDGVTHPVADSAPLDSSLEDDLTSTDSVTRFSSIHETLPEPEVEPVTAPSRCLVCNASNFLTPSDRLNVFSTQMLTSHRQLPAFVVLGGAVKQVLDQSLVHSNIICRRCFNIVDEIDDIEGQLISLKQEVADMYKKTLRESGLLWNESLDLDSRLEKSAAEAFVKQEKGRDMSCQKRQSREDDVSFDLLHLKQEILDAVDSVEGIEVTAGLFGGDRDGGAGGLFSDEEENEIVISADSGLARVRSTKRRFKGFRGSRRGRRPGGRGEVEYFDCPYCPTKYLTESLLGEHINLHTGERPFVCSHCGDAFPLTRLLRRHLRSHGADDTEGEGLYMLPFACNSCEKSFKSQQQLLAHSYSHSRTRVKRWVCQVCSLAVTTEQALSRHSLIHTGEKPFPCSMCGSRFRQKGNLTDHVRLTHMRERRHECMDCGKCFARKRLLSYHTMSVHTGERPFVCSVCNAGFCLPQHLKKHLRTHTGDRPFECGSCGKTFSSKENLKSHMFIHSSVKPYECLLCGVSYMRKQHLFTHMQNHRDVENAENFMKYNPSAMVEAIDGEDSQGGDGGGGRSAYVVRIVESERRARIEHGEEQFVRDGIQVFEDDDGLDQEENIVLSY